MWAVAQDLARERGLSGVRGLLVIVAPAGPFCMQHRRTSSSKLAISSLTVPRRPVKCRSQASSSEASVASHDWQNSYLAAVLETDDSLLPERIKTAEAVLQQRIAELEAGGPKRVEAEYALVTLTILRRERLGD